MENIIAEITDFIGRNVKNFIGILLIVILTAIVLWLISKLARRAERQLMRRLDLDTGSQARLKTLIGASANIAQIIVVGLAVLMVLVTIGVNIAPILTSVGVAGLAVSLGAQTIIKDYIGGFLILFENQFSVGEDIQVGVISGTVDTITLRATYLRDAFGKMVLIPNGDIRTVFNSSRKWARAIVDLNVAFDTDVGKAVEALEEAMKGFQEDAAVKPYLLEPPSVSGWNSFNDWSVQVRLQVKTIAGTQGGVTSALRRYALQSMEKAGVKINTPPALIR